MKKIVIATLLLAATLALASCGSNDAKILDIDGSEVDTNDPVAVAESAQTYDGNTVRLYFEGEKTLTAADFPEEFGVTGVSEFELYEGSGFTKSYDVTVPRSGSYEDFEKTASALSKTVNADACDIVDFVDMSSLDQHGDEDVYAERDAVDGAVEAKTTADDGIALD